MTDFFGVLVGELLLAPVLLAQQPGAGGGSIIESLFGSMMLPLLAPMVLMYFLLMRPEQ